MQAPEVHARCAQAAAAPQIADQEALKESSIKPTSTIKPAQPKAGTTDAVRQGSDRRSSPQEKTHDERRRSPSLDIIFRGQLSRTPSLQRRPSERKSADRTRRDTGKRPRGSPSPRWTRSRSPSLDRRHRGRRSAGGSQREAGTQSRRGPSPVRPRDRSRTGRDCDPHDRKRIARTSGSRERERRYADKGAASEQGHPARRSRSPVRRRGSGSQEMERLRSDKPSSKRPRPRSRSVQRRSSSRERCETGPGGRPTPKVEQQSSPPRQAGRTAAERRNGPAEHCTPGSSSAQQSQSQSSAAAHGQLKQVLANVPSGERANKRPRLQVSAAALPGPEPLESKSSGCAMLKQEESGSQMAATAQDKVQPGASNYRHVGLKRPCEPPEDGFDSSAGKQETRETAGKCAALLRSADLKVAAPKTAPLSCQIAAPDKSRQVEWQKPQSGRDPAAEPAKQLSSPGSAKARAHRVVAVADDSIRHTWHPAANGGRSIWIDEQARCAEQIGDQPHLDAAARPSTTRPACSEEKSEPGEIEHLNNRHSSEQQYSTAEYPIIEGNPGVDRIVHLGREPVSFEMNGKSHRHAQNFSDMPEQNDYSNLSREYPQESPSYQDVGALWAVRCSSSFKGGSSDQTQAPNLTGPPRGQLHAKDRLRSPVSSPTSHGSIGKKGKHASTSTGVRNKQVFDQFNGPHTKGCM